MINRIKEKVYDRFQLKKYYVDKNIFFKGNKPKKIKKIILYFPNSKKMHLGDHLFFEPLARYLKNEGYEVTVSPSKAMIFYFQELGYKIRGNEPFEYYDLIITRSEFFVELKKINNGILFIEYLSKWIEKPICLDIIEKVFDFLELKTKIKNCSPKRLQVKYSSIKLNENSNYILFNNYLDSGKILNGKKRFKKLEKKALQLKKLNKKIKIIHIGTEEEKVRDKKKYNFIDLDLRGKTNIKDLLYLSQQENVISNIGFDAFIMHLFFIESKINYIMIRNKITLKRKKQIEKYFNPPFKKDIIKKEKLHYIN